MKFVHRQIHITTVILSTIQHQKKRITKYLNINCIVAKMSTQFTFGCAICADIFDAQNNVCATRCGHVYHESCLRKWLLTQTRQEIPNTCPKCRTTIRGGIRLFLHHIIAPEIIDNSDNSEITEAKDDDDATDIDDPPLSPSSTVSQTSLTSSLSTLSTITQRSDSSSSSISSLAWSDVDILDIHHDRDFFDVRDMRLSFMNARPGGHMNFLLELERQLDETFDDLNDIRTSTDVLSSNLRTIERTINTWGPNQNENSQRN
ncbi:uncharacterized protein LOC116349987 [Contarinia nasturtii]|uniref:uncharacterized protein LOC116349987 n=1 Tax=Contarinia nasturtii TaxID=265458 RepID=UPI0012D47CE4|nr:uncharacterized protein LOC116349987 [Contarinia nasturtii]